GAGAWMGRGRRGGTTARDQPLRGAGAGAGHRSAPPSARPQVSWEPGRAPGRRTCVLVGARGAVQTVDAGLTGRPRPRRATGVWQHHLVAMAKAGGTNRASVAVDSYKGLRLERADPEGDRGCGTRPGVLARNTDGRTRGPAEG